MYKIRIFFTDLPSGKSDSIAVCADSVASAVLQFSLIERLTGIQIDSVFIEQEIELKDEK